jgi:hypothetical protein
MISTILNKTGGYIIHMMLCENNVAKRIAFIIESYLDVFHSLLARSSYGSLGDKRL